MGRQSSFSRGDRPDRSSSAGAVVLERPEHQRTTTKNGNGARRGGVDQELFVDYAGQVAAIRIAGGDRDSRWTARFLTPTTTF